MNKEKDENGKSKNAVKGGKKVHEEKDENGKSKQAVLNGKRGGAKSGIQVWESTVDGFRSNAGRVAHHNKANGWDPNARKRVG